MNETRTTHFCQGRPRAGKAGKAMSALHLLDVLAGRRCCPVWDLTISPILRRAALSDLCQMDEKDYPLCQWQDTVRYLTGYERDFESAEEIKAFVLKEMEVK